MKFGKARTSLGLLASLAGLLVWAGTARADEEAVAAKETPVAKDAAAAKETPAVKETAVSNYDPRHPYDSGVNPRDHKYIKLQFELLTPQIVGADLSIYLGRHHNLGMGYNGYSFAGSGSSSGSGSGSGSSSDINFEGATYSIMHPRYRYYRGRWDWDSFWELGYSMMHFDGQASGSGGGGGGGGSKTASAVVNASGPDIGFGVNYTSGGFWTIEFMFSVTVLNVTGDLPDPDDLAKTKPFTAMVPVPLIGMGMGFVF